MDHHLPPPPDFIIHTQAHTNLERSASSANPSASPLASLSRSLKLSSSLRAVSSSFARHVTSSPADRPPSAWSLAPLPSVALVPPRLPPATSAPVTPAVVSALAAEIGAVLPSTASEGEGNSLDENVADETVIASRKLRTLSQCNPERGDKAAVIKESVSRGYYTRSATA